MVEISTSILSVETENIIKTIYNLETAKTDYFHIDVMDGEFVKNNTIKKMLKYCDYLTNITNIPLDIHLMVKDIYTYINVFLPYNPNIITIHYESVEDKNEIPKIIQYIQSNNCKAGISIKPNTPANKILDLLNKVHIVLIMTVEPGEGGQKLIESSIEKINGLSKYIKSNNLEVLIEADGGINLENVETLKEAGVDIIVSGTGITRQDDYKKVIDEMRK